MTIADVVANPDLPWYWPYLSNNPNITLADVLANSDKPWDWFWNVVSMNPGITMDDITSNPDLPWDWECVSSNPNINVKFVLENLTKPLDLERLSKNKFGRKLDTIGYYSERRDATVKQMKVFGG
jgi:hypothetical protein